MRGISQIGSSGDSAQRFNPAYAGNMLSKSLENALEQVQPRVCGEYIDIIVYSETIIGSTPRMRGICNQGGWHVSRCRFNPAYAGNILQSSLSAHKTQVQPRVCGEYHRHHNIHLRILGSTPRMRGILTERSVITMFNRFNPAYAGNIHETAHARIHSEVQPRVCGEYFSTEEYAFDELGSTPRMRGIFR